MEEKAQKEFRWEVEGFAELKKNYPFAEKKYVTSKNFCMPPHFEWFIL